MTMCALDTRNDSKGDANAVSFFAIQHSFSVLHHVFENVLNCVLMGGVRHVTTIQIVPLILKIQFFKYFRQSTELTVKNAKEIVPVPTRGH